MNLDVNSEAATELPGSVCMEWFENEFHLLLLKQPNQSAIVEAFNDGPERYSYLESHGSVPIAVWSFMFPLPIGLCEVNFDIRELSEEARRNLLAREHDALAFRIYLDSGVDIHAAQMKIDPQARDAFFHTLKRQAQTPYSQAQFTRHLHALYNFEPEELFEMGLQFSLAPLPRDKATVAPDGNIHRLH